MGKHSPGPWRYDEDAPSDIVYDAHDTAVFVGAIGFMANPADARLIAAAPRLLKELKAVYMATMEYIDREGSCPEVDLVGIEALVREIEGEDTEVCGDCGAEFVGHHGLHETEGEE